MPFRSFGSGDLFHCQKCGECCKGYGGTYVTSDDILAISKFIGVDENEFVEKYCKMSGKKPLLAQKKDGFCVFFDEQCTIHPVKPKMCKAWPFIQSVLKDVQNWHIMAGFCPGMRTDMPNEVIIRVTREVLKGDSVRF